MFTLVRDCVNRVGELFKLFLRGMVVAFLTWSPIKFMITSQDVLLKERFNGHTLGNKITEQTAMALVLRSFPRGI